MPTGADRHSALLLDTSAAVAFCVMDHEAHATTFARLASKELGLAGQAAFETYDGLVAATALEHDLVLVSRDRRAAETYRSLGVRLELLA